MLKASLLTALLYLSSCSHSIHMVHTSDFHPYVRSGRGKPIKAETTQKSVMGFNDNTDYVDEAYALLQEQCPRGRITGITTQFSTSHGFLSWTNKILMQGICMRG